MHLHESTLRVAWHKLYFLYSLRVWVKKGKVAVTREQEKSKGRRKSKGREGQSTHKEENEV